MTVVWHHEHHVHERRVAPHRSRMLWWIALSILVLCGIGGGSWFLWKGWRCGTLPVIVERMTYVPIGYEDGHALWFPSIARLAHGIAAADGRTMLTEADYAQAIDATVRRNALEDIAREEHIVVSDADVRAAVEWSDDIRAFITMAGWNDSEYLAYVERSFVVSTRVNAAVLDDEQYQEKSHERMANIQSKLALGIAFADVAQEYSEDPATAQSRGSFGYVLPRDVDPAFASVFLLPSQTASEVITTADAYWILRTEDSVVDESGTRVLLRGIAIKKQSLAEVLDAKASAIVPRLWVR